MDVSVQERISELRERLSALLSKSPLAASTIPKDKALHRSPAVYLISTPDDSERVYVGRTKTLSIAGRIQDHLHNNTSSDLMVMVRNHKNYPQNPGNYLVRYIEVESNRDRMLLESYFIGVLDPSFNK